MIYKGRSIYNAAFFDILFSLLICCLAIVLVVNHQAKEATPSQSIQAEYTIVMEWPASSNDDMDLWAKDSAGHIVGFNRREGGEGSLMNLNHDNLGYSRNQSGTKLEVNQEVIAIRGVTVGEYVVNCHVYNKNDPTNTPVVVKLVKMKPFAQITIKTNQMIASGDETTFFRFTLDKDGKVSNINSMQELVAQNSLRGQ
jgi:hypothetical protein